MALKRFVVPSLDVTSLTEIERLLTVIHSHDLISGFKIGFSLGLSFGLPKVVETIRRYTDKPVIYDHQKAATDIPETGKLFARIMREAGISTAILFPQAGPGTLQAWIEALQMEDVGVMVGGIMTHARFIESEGGFITDRAVSEIYRLSRNLGVQQFVVPLTKPEKVKALTAEVDFGETAVFYSPGYGSQGGAARAFAFLQEHHVIIGRSLLQASDPRQYLETVREDFLGIRTEEIKN